MQRDSVGILMYLLINILGGSLSLRLLDLSGLNLLDINVSISTA